MVNIIKIADQRRSRTASLFVVNKGGFILLCPSKENVTFGYNYDKDASNCFAYKNLIELFPQIKRYCKKTGIRKKYLRQNDFECNFFFPIFSSINNPKLIPKNKKFDLNRICSAYFGKKAEQNLKGA